MFETPYILSSAMLSRGLVYLQTYPQAGLPSTGLVQVLNHGLSLVCLCGYRNIVVGRTKDDTKLGFRGGLRSSIRPTESDVQIDACTHI